MRVEQVGVVLAVWFLLIAVGRVSSLGSIAHLYIADEVLQGLDATNPEISALIKRIGILMLLDATILIRAIFLGLAMAR